MVAIKPAHERISHKDLWQGLPWVWGDEHRIRDMLRAELIASGITEHPELFFAEGRAWERYMKSFPNFKQRQQIMASIYPMKLAVKQPIFSDEELDYLEEKLFGVNDEIGQMILEKLRKFKDEKAKE